MWTPYQNLVYLAYSRQNRRADLQTLYRYACNQAKSLALLGYDDKLIEDHWPSLYEGAPEVCDGLFFSDELRFILFRGRRRTRRVLDRLILGYASNGFRPKDVYEEVYKDYCSCTNLPAINKKDVAMYAAFYWNFASLLDLEKGQAWLHKHMPNSIELSIINDELTLDDIRSQVGALRGLEYEKRLKKLAYKSMRALENCIDEVNRENRDELMHLSGGSNANLRNLAAMIGSLTPVMNAYGDLDRDDEDDLSLGEYLNIRLEKIREESEPYEEHYGEWEEHNKARTMEDLQEENKLTQ